MISSQPYETDAIATEFTAWNLASEAADLDRFDIGIMPLAPNVFAEGKCAFKAIQCM